MLGWSLIDVSQAARVSVSVVRRLENSSSSTAGNEYHSAMQATFEAAGVVFLPDEGHGPGLRLGACRTEAT